jgi:tagatose 6-phosphate kinase
VTAAPVAPRRILCVAANPSIDRLYEVERLVPGEVHRPTTVTARAGGKGLNAARAAAAIGAQVTAAALIGGHAGSWIADRLTEAGIEVVVARSPAETRTCVSVVDRENGRLTEFYERGESVPAEDWERLVTAITARLEHGDIAAMTLSGSLPTGAPVDGFAHLVRVASAAGVLVLADVYGPALAAVLLECPAIVKVNAAEAAEILGSDASAAHDPDGAVTLARGIVARGAARVVVTLGAGGSIGIDVDGSPIHLGSPAVQGAYPVGSGDAFLAGLATATVDGAGFAEAMRVGAAAGAANAALPGTGDLDLGLFLRLVNDQG